MIQTLYVFLSLTTPICLPCSFLFFSLVFKFCSSGSMSSSPRFILLFPWFFPFPVHCVVNVFIPLELFHLLSHYYHKQRFILLKIYATVVYNFKVERKLTINHCAKVFSHLGKNFVEPPFAAVTASCL